MRVIKQARDVAATAHALRRAGTSIGFVPTMGALHDGHCSLIGAADRQTQVAVVSIFVNPLQFSPQEDFARYPRDLKRDLSLAKASGCDLVFAPDVSQMYGLGFCTSVEVAGLSDELEGRLRPGHFKGVTTVVAKLFNLVQPTVAYFGQKDFQQAVIIRRMVKDLAFPVAVRVLPIVREPDGLAMSSRNVYLAAEERGQAGVIYRALQDAKARIKSGERSASRIVDAMRRLIGEQSLARIEDLAIVHQNTLEPMERLVGPLAVLAVVRFGATRLIDNILVDVS